MNALFAPVLALFLLLVPNGGWLGVYLAADRDEAVVTEVVPNSPAAKAGIKAGDILIAVGDTATPSRDKLIATIGAASPGDRVALKIKRGDQRVLLMVKLGKRPSENVVAETDPPTPAGSDRRPGKPASEGRSVDRPDVAVVTQAPAGVFLGVSVTEGDGKLMIDRVLDGSPAEAAGLKAGEQLATIGNARLRSLSDLDKALKGMRVGKAVEVGLRGKDSRRSVMLKPGKRPTSDRRVAVAPAEEIVEVTEEAPKRRVAAVRRTTARNLEPIESAPRVRRLGKPAKPAKPVKAAKPAKPAKPAKAAKPAKTSGPESSSVDDELKALRRELAGLKKELQELRKQIRRQRGK